MVVLLGIGSVLAIYDSVSFEGSPTAQPSSSTASGQKKVALAEDNSFDQSFRPDILAYSQRISHEAGRNIFRLEDVGIVKIEDKGRSTPEEIPIPNAAPLPPIALKFYGFANKPNEPKRIFLTDADEVFVAKQGDIVERKYKVVQINNASVVIEDMLYNNRQPIPLTAR